MVKSTDHKLKNKVQDTDHKLKSTVQEVEVYCEHKVCLQNSNLNNCLMIHISQENGLQQCIINLQQPV